MPTAREHFLDWLRDAHAMEEQAIKMLETTASRIENYPDLKAGLERHLEETRRQSASIRSCIERLGGDTSVIKEWAMKLTGFAQGASGLFVTDEVVKAGLASYTFEHMEIASYRSLIAAAEALGEHQTADVCRGILAEEEAMAAWLAQQLPVVTQTFLQRAGMPNVTAKH
ncbi:MAG TPA: ferritin-like domain-containing protein [Burkholderiaceae bacterium]|nr:ferritin-like domain-containing protein [Burkholderiaceae bacterium]